MLMALVAAFCTGTVTLQTPIESLPVVVAKVAQQTKLDLRVHKSLRDEHLKVWVTGRDQQWTLDRIAEVVGAEWQIGNSGERTLLRSVPFTRRLEREGQLERAQTIQRDIQGRYGSIPLEFGTDSEVAIKQLEVRAKERAKMPREARDQVALMAGPTARLLGTILLKMDPAQLAAVPVGRSVSWSTRPNRVRRAFTSSQVAFFNRYLAEYRLLYHHLQTLGAELRERTTGVLMPYEMLDREMPKEPSLQLIVRHTPQDHLMVDLAVQDEDFRTIASNSNEIDLRPQDSPKLSWPESSVRAAYKPRFKYFELTQNREVRLQARAMLESQDATEVFYGGFFDAFREKAFGEMIVAVPDNLIDLLVEERGLREACKEVSNSVSFSQEDSVLLGKLRQPLEETELRTNREAFAKKVKSLQSSPVPNFDDMLAYELAERPFAGLSAMSGLVLRCLFDFEDPAGLGTDPMGPRLYGALSAIQRTAIAQGQAIPFPQLTPAAQAVLREFAETREMFLMPGSLPAHPAEYTGPRSGFDLADGALNEAVLSGKLKTSEVLVITDHSGEGQPGRFWEAESLGYVLFQQRENGTWLDGGGGYPIVEKCKFIPAIRNTLDMRLSFTNGYVSQASVTGYQSVAGAKATGYNSLPQGLFDQMKKTYDSYVAREKGGAKAPPLQRVPPP